MRSKLSIKKRLISLCGDIDEDMYTFFDIAATELESKSMAPIRISLNSEGGNISDALAIAGRIKASEHKYIIEVYGACMSSALCILAVGTVRHMSRYALAMHHESSNSYEDFSVTQLKESLRAQELQDKIFCGLMADHTSKKAEWWAGICIKKDVYLTPENCLKIKLIDKII